MKKLMTMGPYTEEELDKMFEEMTLKLEKEEEQWQKRAGIKITTIPVSKVVKEDKVEKEEEKCSTCGRMKDVGVKCWWCGN